MDKCLKTKVRSGFPIFGTCAGMILLARNVSNHSNCHLQLIDITVKRNAYGRQLDSFEAELNIDGIGPFPAVFIRAPYVEDVGARVDVLARYEDKPVMARQKNILCCSFHPELTDNTGVHRYFGDMIEKRLYK